MSKYNNSKIYKIIDNTNGNIYIGSTFQKYITTRLAGHVADYKRYLKNKFHYITSFEIIKNGNYDIVLIENVNCETKEQLHARERFYIESMVCINQVIPARSFHEYYIQNKDIIIAKTKEYRNEHKEEISEKKRIKYNIHKKEINEKAKIKFTCCCGSECRISDKARHEKSMKHQTYLKTISY
jgi:hypothetical protein